VNWVHDLCAALDIPPLRNWGVTEADFELLVEKSAASSSMQGNPIKLTPEEMHNILAQAL
jgi:alcohol dehydrogenase class IV